MAMRRTAGGQAAASLAARLRALRRDEFAPLTQDELARALGSETPISPTAISQWESPTSGRLPTPARLAAYARLFCTERSFSGETPRLLDDAELTPEERERLGELRDELLDLRRLAEAVAGAAGAPGHVWTFTDGAPVTVVCADMPAELRPPYADQRHRNFVRASSFADLDALLDLFGYLRAENPETDVRIRAADDLRHEELRGHLVVLGGASWYTEVINQVAGQVVLPVQQDPDRDDIFVVKGGGGPPGGFRPTFIGPEDEQRLVEDFGLFARAPNPQAPRRTLTICSGITTRGVRGAVLCFTDSEIREENEAYIAARFPDRPASFGVLMRVEVMSTTGESLAPHLSRKDTALLEWADGDVKPAQSA